MKKSIILLTLFSCFLITINAQGDRYGELDNFITKHLKKNPIYDANTSQEGDRNACVAMKMHVLEDFVSSELKYPELAREYRVEGKVNLNFLVEKDGSLSNFEVKDGIGFGCDEEAIRIIESFPAWKPAIRNGEVVAQSANIEIHFRLK